MKKEKVPRPRNDYKNRWYKENKDKVTIQQYKYWSRKYEKLMETYRVDKACQYE
jgi:hypothetical protein